MSSGQSHIIPYEEKYLEEATQLEKGIVQGRQIKLEMIKHHFLDRARVFKKKYTCLALSDEDHVIGAATGAQTSLMINGEPFDAGIIFDIKVQHNRRREGIGQLLAKDIFTQFFKPNNLTRNFITAKLSNLQAFLLAARVASTVWYYDFVYLAVPTNRRLKTITPVNASKYLLSVKLFNAEDLPRDYYSQFESGLGYFHTYRMYKLRIKNVRWWMKGAIALMKRLWKKKYGNLPGENDLLSFATLYNHTPHNIGSLNEILADLEEKGIRELMVCCRRHDAIFKALRKLIIYTYDYNILSDFNLSRKDRVEIDVRCL